MTSAPSLTHEHLKQRHRAEREGHHPNLALRVHRALSWLDRAERTADDPDAQFIFQWIAFNAAYATEIDDRWRLSEQATFQEFLRKLLSLDTRRCIDELVWNEFTGSIRLMLDNRYLFADFWDFHAGKLEEEEWKRRFEGARRAAQRALAAQDTGTVLGIVLGRIYVLRNQIVHGGATWNSSVNRAQIRDCTRFLGKLVPVVLEIMLNNPQTIWGDAAFPIIEAQTSKARGMP